MKLVLYFSILVNLFILITSNLKSKRRRRSSVSSLSDNSTNSVLPNITYRNLTQPNVTKEKISEMVERILISKPRKSIEQGEFYKMQKGRFDFSMNNAEIKQLFEYMLLKQEKEISEDSLYVFAHIYVKDWMMCDADESGTMSFEEFEKCMKNSTFLNNIKIPNSDFSDYVPNNGIPVEDAQNYYKAIFVLFDEKKWGFLNFLQYMNLRLYSFSLRFCGVSGPYLDEVGFECALDVVANYKSISRPKVKAIYNFIVEMVYSENLRTLDFISFVGFTQPIRLYGKINTKEDDDVRKTDIDLALDSDILPPRYSQEINNIIFKLIETIDVYGSSLDLESFMFYDYFLKAFTTFSFERKGHLSRNEFFNLLQSKFFLPIRFRNEIGLIPQYNLTRNSYKMYMFSKAFYSEEDHLYKSFLELQTNLNAKNNKINSRKYHSRSNKNNFNGIEPEQYGSDPGYPIKTSFLNGTDSERKMNVSFSAQKSSDILFNILDLDGDNYVNFYDFGHFTQVCFLFSKLDTFIKGRVSVESFRELISTWNDFPSISYLFKDRVNKLNLLDNNSVMDISLALAIVKIEDAVKIQGKGSNQSFLGEIELKLILKNFNMENIPEEYLTKCLRVTDNSLSPRYDWECAFIEGVKANSKYFDTVDYYNLSKFKNITLQSTGFFNIDNK